MTVGRGTPGGRQAAARRRQAGPGPAIEVTIDEVVLRGVPPERARAVVAELEATLGAHARGVVAAGERPSRLASGRDEASRRARGTVGATLAPPGQPARGPGLGAALADAVWQEVAGTTAHTRRDTGEHGP